MKRAFSLFLLSVLSLSLNAQIKLSEEAKISIITCSPSEDAVFTVYGHTAVRVVDPLQGIDVIFNYGIFDFSKSDFIYRFAKGETDYKLDVTHFKHFIVEYQMRGSDVTEQVLNLTQTERERLWEALQINARPENAVYRYNFFYDNCSTRPVVLVEKYVEGEVVYNHISEPHTFRQLINYAERNQPWLVFGTDLALGSPTNRIATPHEEMFLPLYLKAAFAEATILSPDGSVRNLVAQTHMLIEGTPCEMETEFFTPLVFSLIFLAIVLLLTWSEWHRKIYYRWFDCLLFFIAGISGVVLFFLAFVSEHPATWPNWLIIWLHPFHLVGVVLFAVKKFNKAVHYYHFINFAALTLMLLGWYFIPQHFNMAFLPLVVSYWVRSAGCVFVNKLVEK